MEPSKIVGDKIFHDFLRISSNIFFYKNRCLHYSKLMTMVVVNERKKRKAVNEDTKRALFIALLSRVAGGRLAGGSFASVAIIFDLTPRTVASQWYSILSHCPLYQPNAPLNVVDLQACVPEAAFKTKFANAGRKPKYDLEEMLGEIAKVDPRARRSVRSLAGVIGIPRATIARMKKLKLLRAHTMALKPLLGDHHRVGRIYHCISKINPNTINCTTGMTYKTFYDEIHLDEKWFYLQKDGARYLLTFDEPDPECGSTRHKSHITKVLFLSAVARPRFNHTTRQWFDGLIGIYPAGYIGAYQRRTKHHNVGDPKWVDVSITKDVYRKMLVEKVLPDILAKWPDSNPILLQQDGAPAHINDDDEVFKQKVLELFSDAGAVRLYTQPAQSPDLNINDLGFFASLQSKYYMHSPKDALELIEMIEGTFQSYPLTTLNRIWLTLQGCMNEILDNQGDNKYKIPHMNKDRLERTNSLPVSIKATESARHYSMAELTGELDG